MAEEWHISAELFRRFLRREGTRTENRRLVRHLLGECTFCSALATRLMDEEGYWFPKRSQGLTPDDYDKTFASAGGLCPPGDPPPPPPPAPRLGAWGPP